jgi:hypothetical protein
MLKKIRQIVREKERARERRRERLQLKVRELDSSLFIP